MKVRVLTPGSARLWFEALSKSAPSGEQLASLEALLETGPLRPHLRIVVEQRERPFGRLAAHAEEGVVVFWNPDFADATSPDDMGTAMRLMIRHLAAARQEADLFDRVIENRCGDDIPHNDRWLCALAQEGYARTCTYRAYALPLDQAPEPVGVPGLSIGEIASDQTLVALYRRVKADTLQLRNADLDRPEDAIAAMRRMGRGHNPSTWLVAHLDGTAAGYALANLADEPGHDSTSGWLVDIGCVPEQRQQSIASALLGEIARRLRSAGARTLLAAIDDVNVPSIRLHTRFGFQPDHIRHYIYQLAASLTEQ